MRIKIYLCAPKPLALPLSYHHIIQGFLYHCLMENPDFSGFLHERGYGEEERHYKLFCFSLLKGEYRIVQKQIIFSGEVMLEVGSIDDVFLRILTDVLMAEKQFELYRQTVSLDHIEVWNRPIETISAQIEMISPVTVHRTALDEEGRRRTIYYHPWDAAFRELICDNYVRKYTAFYGTEPFDEVSIVPVHVSERDKYVTRFKGQTMVTGWKGIYQLTGSKEALNFLYQTGIGDRNSQGFGMFALHSPTSAGANRHVC